MITTILANVAIPTAMIFAPAMLLLLAPIILLEARSLRKLVQPVPAHSLRVATVANLVSTFVGVPLVSFAAWVLPTPAREAMVIGPSDPSSSDGNSLGGLLLLYLSMFTCSVLVEWAVAWSMLRHHRGIGVAVLAGNVLTYILLPFGMGAVLVLSIT